MDTIREKIAYLRGMLDGTGDITQEEQLKHIIQRLIDILDELADDVDDLFFGLDEIEEYVEAVDADLADLEEFSCDCDAHDSDLELDMVELECPSCQNLVAFEEDFLYDDGEIEISCPECGETIYYNDSSDLDDDYEDEDFDD